MWVSACVVLLALAGCSDDTAMPSPDAAPRPYLYTVTIHGHGSASIAGASLPCAPDLCSGQLQIDPQSFGQGATLTANPESQDWALTGETIDAMPTFLAQNMAITTPGDHTIDLVFTALQACSPIAVLPAA